MHYLLLLLLFCCCSSCPAPASRMATQHNTTQHNPLLTILTQQIVHCCGYDSVPFDLGVLLLADHARKQLGK